LVAVVAAGWCAFGVAGVGLRWLAPPPGVTVLIDRSYCDPSPWEQKVLQPYENLYKAHQKHQTTITQVVLYGDLGQQVLSEVPTPEFLANLKPNGRNPSPERRQDLFNQFPQAQILSCTPSP